MSENDDLDVFAVDKCKLTPLHYACIKGIVYFDCFIKHVISHYCLFIYFMDLFIDHIFMIFFFGLNQDHSLAFQLLSN